MTQQQTAPMDQSFVHLLDLEEVKLRVQTCFEYWAEKDKDAGAGVNPTLEWRDDPTPGRLVADLSLSANNTVLAGLLVATPSSEPGVKKDGTVLLRVFLPPELRLVAPQMVNTVKQEVEKWLKM